MQAHEKSGEPNRRLVRGTWSFDEEERRPLVRAYGSNCWERYGGKPVSKTLNVSVAAVANVKFDSPFHWEPVELF